MEYILGAGFLSLISWRAWSNFLEYRPVVSRQTGLEVFLSVTEGAEYTQILQFVSELPHVYFLSSSNERCTHSTELSKVSLQMKFQEKEQLLYLKTREMMGEACRSLNKNLSSNIPGLGFPHKWS